MASVWVPSYDSVMRHIPRFVAVAVLCGALVACGSSTKKDTTGTKAATTIAVGSGGASGGAVTTQPATSGGKANCTGVQDAVAGMIINWQVVRGLANVDVSQWGSTPVGTLPKFGDQLKVMTAALGSDADAAAALKFMTGANDIVVRGVGGDANAKADLAKYLGTDLTANIKQQLPISLAYEKAGCK
jgi:hypothetical protein